MEEKKCGCPQEKNPKTAVNNQWDNANLRYYPDKRERRDGPGGEDNDAK